MAEFNISNSSVGQLNESGTNIHADAPDQKKTWWDHFNIWYAIVGTTATILSGMLTWYVMHLQYGWWFFGFIRA